MKISENLIPSVFRSGLCIYLLRVWCEKNLKNSQEKREF